MEKWSNALRTWQSWGTEVPGPWAPQGSLSLQHSSLTGAKCSVSYVDGLKISSYCMESFSRRRTCAHSAAWIGLIQDIARSHRWCQLNGFILNHTDGCRGWLPLPASRVRQTRWVTSLSTLAASTCSCSELMVGASAARPSS